MKTFRIAVALPQDVLDVKDDLREVEQEVNRIATQENREARVEIVRWYEDDGSLFHRESPHLLFEQIVGDEHPDIIIGVFWNRFGRVQLDKAWEPHQEWPRIRTAWRQSATRTMLYLCDKQPQLSDDEAEAQYRCLQDFKDNILPGELWWFYKAKSSVKNKQRRPNDLFSLLTAHLVDVVRGWLNFSDADGWEYLSLQELDEVRASLDADGKLIAADASDFFSGRKRPGWKEALSDSVPRRTDVGEVLRAVRTAAEETRFAITLLKGPGGEGKSTILRQVAVDLTNLRCGIHVIWHEKTYTPLRESFVRQMLEHHGKFVIVSDDAELIARDVSAALESLQRRSTCNLQFLLASRTMDWNCLGAQRDEWRWKETLGSAGFRLFNVRSLTLKDAKEIVAAWERADVPKDYSEDFTQTPPHERPQKLLRMAQAEQRFNPEDGSFFGAILGTRRTDSFSEYFERKILDKLADADHALIGPHHEAFQNLRDVVAGIAVLHTDYPQPILYRPVLLHALSYDEQQFRDVVAEKLEGEVSATSYLITMRHRRIAELAAKILNEKFPALLENKILPRLVEASRDAVLNKDIERVEATPWNKLPNFYFGQRRERLAVRLATALADRERYDPFPVTKLAKIYRDWAKRADDKSKLDNAAKECRDRFPDLKSQNKGFYLEWSLAEGLRGKHCLSTVLAGFALTDSVQPRPKDSSWLPMLLSGLTSSFGGLYKKCIDTFDINFRDPAAAEVFGKALAAVAQLGLNSLNWVRTDQSTTEDFDARKCARNLETGLTLAADAGFATALLSESLQHVRAGIELAWQLRERDQDVLPEAFTANFKVSNMHIVARLFGLQIDDAPVERGASSSAPFIRKPPSI